MVLRRQNLVFPKNCRPLSCVQDEVALSGNFDHLATPLDMSLVLAVATSAVGDLELALHPQRLWHGFREIE